MAKLLVVKSGSTLVTKGNIEGDIIAYYEDDWKPGTKEAYQIANGVFEVIDIKGTREEVQLLHNELIPSRKEVWFDKTDGTWKDLVDQPNKMLKIIDGVVSHNLDVKAENLVITNETAITEKVMLATKVEGVEKVL